VSELQRALAVALRAAALARNLILAECARPDGPRGEIGHAPVDDEAELAIRQVLESEFPDWGYLGEETGSKSATSGHEYVWFVDPNDGTSSMQRGYRGHAVSIGLARAGVPVLGVVWAVNAPDDRGDLISWAEGCGPIHRNGRPLVPRGWSDDLRADDVVGLSQGAMRNPVGYLPCISPASYITSPSIAYRLALVAAGDHVATVSLNYLRPWDYAAGHALVRAAGGVMLDGRGESIDYPTEGVGAVTPVFAGHRPVVEDLLRRPWDAAPGSGFGVAIPPSELAPIRAKVSCLIHDPDVLSRAQGCLLGHLSSRSELGLMLARHLVFRGAFDQESIAAAYAAWYHGWTHTLEPEPCDHPWCRPGSVDPVVAAALDHVTADDVRQRRSAAIAISAANAHNRSDAALTRVAPIGIWGTYRPIDEVAAAARQDTRLTQPDPMCQSASALLAVTISAAIRDRLDAEQTYAFALEHASNDEVRRALENSSGHSTGLSHSDSALGVIHDAFFQLLHRSNFEPDTPTAIPRALLGAVYGREWIPEHQRRTLLSCRPMPGQPRVREPRPALYWSTDALLIAERLLTSTPAVG
jgi:ADP-ribosyl-[dinitrogen reductase] hydrolase